MRALLLASMLGSAMSLTSWNSFLDWEWWNEDMGDEGGFELCSVSGIDDSDWFSQNPIRVTTSEDLDHTDENQWYFPPQRIETQTGRKDWLRLDYLARIDELATVSGRGGSFKEFIKTLFYFAGLTGIHHNHVEHVKMFADATRLVAAHAEALSTGAVKSKADIWFYGKENSWGECYGAPRPGIDGVTSTVHQDRLNEWKQGPFNMDPMPNSLMGQLESLQSCGE